MQSSDWLQLIAIMIGLVALCFSARTLYKMRRQIEIANLVNYSKSYRDLTAKLPTAIYGVPCEFRDFTEDELRALFGYFGLLQEEFRLKMDIDKDTWEDWRQNLLRHASNETFLKAWLKVQNYFDFPLDYTVYMWSTILEAKMKRKGTSSEIGKLAASSRDFQAL